jgi:hypothetical protein
VPQISFLDWTVACPAPQVRWVLRLTDSPPPPPPPGTQEIGQPWMRPARQFQSIILQRAHLPNLTSALANFTQSSIGARQIQSIIHRRSPNLINHPSARSKFNQSSNVPKTHPLAPPTQLRCSRSINSPYGTGSLNLNHRFESGRPIIYGSGQFRILPGHF